MALPIGDAQDQGRISGEPRHCALGCVRGKERRLLLQFARGLRRKNPGLFTRVLDASLRKSSRTGGAFYIGDAWQPAPGLEFDYRARFEGSSYGDAPARNPAVEATFGIRTDQFPSQKRLSPRFGFTYASGGDKEDEGGLT